MAEHGEDEAVPLDGPEAPDPDHGTLVVELPVPPDAESPVEMLGEIRIAVSSMLRDLPTYMKLRSAVESGAACLGAVRLVGHLHGEDGSPPGGAGVDVPLHDLLPEDVPVVVSLAARGVLINLRYAASVLHERSGRLKQILEETR